LNFKKEVISIIISGNNPASKYCCTGKLSLVDSSTVITLASRIKFSKRELIPYFVHKFALPQRLLIPIPPSKL
jgi:hypothetical protein